jgi:hypothetical protein
MDTARTLFELRKTPPFTVPQGRNQTSNTYVKLNSVMQGSSTTLTAKTAA